MNFLAHALLAGDHPADRVGGLLGDFVKGPLPAGLPPALASGVALHRAIDSFAETHPAFRASRARVGSERRRLAGILVDLFYDHLLARQWADHCAEPLEAFVARLHGEVARHEADLPAHALEIAALMRRQRWLESYRELAAVGSAIDRMAVHRLRRPNALAGGIAEFSAAPDGYAADFRAFLPDALRFAANWRKTRQ